jgi:hypothetical protein
MCAFAPEPCAAAETCLTVENTMYLVLGALAAGLLALLVMPAIWRRAVRLTRRRIEAATPMTMAEFQADKDRLRAEFALETQRLEATIEGLRARLVTEVDDTESRIGTVAKLRQEREAQAGVIREMHEREAELHDQLHSLEKQLAETAAHLRTAEREIEERERQAARAPAQGEAPEADAGAESGPAGEPPALLTAERQRNAALIAGAEALLARLEAEPTLGQEARAAIAAFRATLEATPEATASAATDELRVAEARIAQAESRLKRILEETGPADAAEPEGRMLADRLSIEERMATVRHDVAEVETTLRADWGTERQDADALREKLGRIAVGVERLVAEMQNAHEETGESLFERVSRFSEPEEKPAQQGPAADIAAPEGNDGAAGDRPHIAGAVEAAR